MKKVFQVICCAAGAGMIGFFANQLNTVIGCVFFTLGVVLLVGSIIPVSQQDKDNTDEKPNSINPDKILSIVDELRQLAGELERMIIL